MHGKSAVIVISGFLGAGKTTLLKKILTWESDLSETVVIVNEFGDVRTVRISRAFMD
jgi:G3E family GTPase